MPLPCFSRKSNVVHCSSNSESFFKESYKYLYTVPSYHLTIQAELGYHGFSSQSSWEMLASRLELIPLNTVFIIAFICRAGNL